MVDGSEESKKALLECLKIVDKSKDHVECLSCDTDGGASKLKTTYEAILAGAKVVNSKFTILSCAGGTVPEVICKHFTKEDTPDYDFVVLGSKGAGVYKKPGTHYLGTVAEKVITTARTNLIVVVK